MGVDDSVVVGMESVHNIIWVISLVKIQPMSEVIVGSEGQKDVLGYVTFRVGCGDGVEGSLCMESILGVEGESLVI